MKVLFSVFILVLALNGVLGAVSVSLPSIRTDCSSGTCIDYCDYDKANILPGEFYNDGCSLAVCHLGFSMNFESCGVAASDDCLRFGPDNSLSYPHCCNKICLAPAY